MGGSGNWTLARLSFNETISAKKTPERGKQLDLLVGIGQPAERGRKKNRARFLKSAKMMKTIAEPKRNGARFPFYSINGFSFVL